MLGSLHLDPTSRAFAECLPNQESKSKAKRLYISLFSNHNSRFGVLRFRWHPTREGGVRNAFLYLGGGRGKKNLEPPPETLMGMFEFCWKRRGNNSHPPRNSSTVYQGRLPVASGRLHTINDAGCRGFPGFNIRRGDSDSADAT